jgi:hypothetical protein
MVRVFHEASDGALLIGADGGLFRHNDYDLVPIGADQEIEVGSGISRER